MAKAATAAVVKSSKATKAKEAADHRKAVQRAAALLKQVSDPTRLQVMLMLTEGEKHVGAICEAVAMTQPAVSHHLALLRHGGLVEPRRVGKNRFYTLTESGKTLAEVVKGLVD